MRKLAITAFSFAAGTLFAQYLLPERWLLPAAAVFFALGLAGLLLKGNARLRVFLMAGGLCAAALYYAGYCTAVLHPAQALDSATETALLELCDYPEATEYGAKVTVRLPEAGLRLTRAVFYGDETLLTLTPGQRLRGTVSFARADEANGEKLNNFTAKGVYLFLYGRGEMTVETGAQGSLRYLPKHLAHKTKEMLAQLYTGDTMAMAQALLLGDRSALSEEVYVHLTETSLYHITAVSGLHCGFLLSLTALLVGKQRRRLLAAVAIPLLFGYALLVGAPPSVVRAGIMLTMLLAAPLLGRESDSVTSLSFALLLVLLQNPFAVASVGLQLSFASVGGIIWATPKLYRALGNRETEKKKGVGRLCRRARNFAAASFATTLGAMVFTVPLCAVYFNILSLVAPVSNLFCLWAVSWAFPFALLSVPAGYSWLPLGKLLALVAQGLLGYVMDVAALLAKIPYHAVYFSNSFLKFWLVYVYAMLAACCLTPKARRKNVLAGVLAAATLALTVALNARLYRYGAMHMSVLNVGQGESVLFASGGATALMDCGSSNRYIDAGTVAADAAASIDSTLDYVILSHYHADHANGFARLFARVKVGTLYLPDIGDEYGLRREIEAIAGQYGTKIVYVTEDMTLPLGEAVLRLYAPLGSGDTNEEGLTLLCSAGAFDVLVTGDMDAATEQKLLDHAALPDIEVLVAGHHGSKDATSRQLLQAAAPEVGIISVGDNRYGHPTVETLGRLQAAKVDVYRTDQNGTVRVRVN